MTSGEIIVPGTIWTESEFQVDGEFATCGPNAAGMAECWGAQSYLGDARPGETATSGMYHRMRTKGRCDPDGASTGGGLAAQLAADGYRIERPGYRSRYARSDWLRFIQESVARPAVVVTELAAAHNLHDTVSDSGEDAGSGLSYHYVLAVGYHPGGASQHAGGRSLPEGIWCADGDSNANNPVVRGHRTRIVAGHALQFYPLDVFDAAAPCDLDRGASQGRAASSYTQQSRSTGRAGGLA